LHFPQLAYFDTHPGHPAVTDLADHVQKTFALSFWFGHTTPHRPSEMCTLLHPDHIPASCPVAGCKIDKCRGNRFERSRDGKVYELVLPHTKNNKSVPIFYPLPSSMFIWADLHLTWAWPIIAAKVGESMLVQA
jgi:hypothetical protein